jgi:hypothetical protein
MKRPRLFLWRARSGVRVRSNRRTTALWLELLEDRSCPSITFQFDYSLDATGFFNSPQRRAVLELAGQYLGSHLNDSLLAINPVGGNSWTASFDDPSTGALRNIFNLNVPANTLIVFAGGQNNGGASVGEGGFGGWSASGSSDWLNTVAARGQVGALSSTPTDVGPWGGSLSFDTNTNWYFGGPGQIPPNFQYDFYSIALHELGHVLGIGTAASWSRLVSGGHFYGASSFNASDQGGHPATDASGSHWAPGTTVGGAEADMTPYITAGTQKQFTALDWDGLRDIGWQIDTSAPASATPNTVSSTAPPGATTIGVYNPASATWVLRNSNSGGVPDAGVFQFGPLGAIPLDGDWTGTGHVGIGIFDPATATWDLRNSVGSGGPDFAFQYGPPGSIPVVGDWTGTGHTGIGIFDPRTATWMLRNSVSAGAPDFVFQYGPPGSIPLVGDWTGTGHAGIGIFDPGTSTWDLRNLVSAGGPDIAFQYGPAGSIPVVGDWTSSGHAGIGIFDPHTSTWMLHSAAGAGVPDVGVFQYGGSFWRPVVGAWLGDRIPPRPADIAVPASSAASPLGPALVASLLDRTLPEATVPTAAPRELSLPPIPAVVHSPDFTAARAALDPLALWAVSGAGDSVQGEETLDAGTEASTLDGLDAFFASVS